MNTFSMQISYLLSRTKVCSNGVSRLDDFVKKILPTTSPLGCSILCTVLPNNFFGVGHNFFPLFRSKALQKTKNWKFLWIFSPGKCPSKFYYITLVCEMELGRKFKFFPIFYYKTILFSSESEFSMKNVIFWGTSCWCSSKTKKVDGGLISCNCSLWVPLRIF